MLRCVLFEDEHLLVIDKPAGVNTHAPAPYAGEGIYDWLRSREPRWSTLAIVHRLDKETSGVMVFPKTRQANRSLTQQFTERSVTKAYWLLSDRNTPDTEVIVRSALFRAGERYGCRPGADAITRFRKVALPGELRSSTGISAGALSAIEAEPLTGRTHQIRVHAAAEGFPILGDTLYGGTPAKRVFLHARSLRFRHPVTNGLVSFEAPVDFDQDPRLRLREAFIEPELTDCFRLIHGAGDNQDGWYVDKLGPYLLSQAGGALDSRQQELLSKLLKVTGARGAGHKLLRRDVRRTVPSEANVRPVLGERPQESFSVLENGMRYQLSIGEGYSVGLFLDQRENRRRLLTGWVGPGFPLWPGDGAREALNTFAYTCAFSVCAAKSGARVTSVDLSKKYLDWGRRNFVLNGLPDSEHDFIYGDTFEWLKRFAKKRRRFDLVLLDPPTFSVSKVSGTFRTEKDYGRLVAGALAIIKPGGVLFASSNTAGWTPEGFLQAVQAGTRAAGRTVQQQQYFPQPPDFPVSRAEPAYLKTMWLRVD